MVGATDLSFLKESDLFENQPEAILHAVLVQGHMEEYGPETVVFRQGDRGDKLYIVKSGVLEILARPADSNDAMPVAYLGKGEVLGELALITGSARTATARCPERAELFTLEQPVFRDLMSTLPDFSRNLCFVLAKRLEVTTLKVPRVSTKQLQGNLRYFDLATVIQTLIGSHQTGLLAVAGTDKLKIAEIIFFKGNIGRARFRHLSGDDAVLQLFQSPLEGEFSFSGRSYQEDDMQDEITMPAISLLMESVRLQDELPVLREQLPDPRRVFRQKAVQLQWDDQETVELAATMWMRLKKGASLDELERDIPRCTYWIYKTLATLLDTGQVE